MRIQGLTSQAPAEAVLNSRHADEDKLGDTIHRIVTWRIMPLLIVSYIFAHLDRINIGFAKLQMTSDLGFSDTAYGLGAGLFFIAYAIFGVPCNIMLDKVGPRRWIAFIMIVWGILSASTLLVTSAQQFYVVRFLLGIAECSFYPGMLVYINRWFPGRRRGQIIAIFSLSVPAAGLIGGPVSGWILESFNQFAGLRGWQWMFLLEGLPVLLLGVIVYCVIPDRIKDAPWLDKTQKDYLTNQLAREASPVANTSLWACISDAKIWQLVGIYFSVMLAVNTIAFWMPALIHETGIASDATIGLLSALPYLAGCIAMVAFGYSSDRRAERRWHLVIPSLMAAGGLFLVGFAAPNPMLVMLGLIIAGMGASASLPQFWQLPPSFIAPGTQAAGFAFISCLGNLAAFVAPYFIGWMRDQTQSSSIALYVLAALIALGGLMALRFSAAIVNQR
ncbi:MFS family permease [Ochrobactrum sp. P6BSIII]|uniref:MFS transporter n=1 Tax=unclassified Ochrobactrum TaxID=239106 RepID=UPI000991DA3D|nr:MFS family permease [Ochrobactrum sp. P6BSIII]